MQGIKDHEHPIDTHPHDWKIERKSNTDFASRNQKEDTNHDSLTTAKEEVATVMHSYPSTERPSRRAQNKPPETASDHSKSAGNKGQKGPRFARRWMSRSLFDDPPAVQ
jgi:hypothetical protein